MERGFLGLEGTPECIPSHLQCGDLNPIMAPRQGMGCGSMELGFPVEEMPACCSISLSLDFPVCKMGLMMRILQRIVVRLEIVHITHPAQRRYLTGNYYY